MVYNGTQYRYITNLQGDIVEIRDANDSTVVTYTYDAWGKILTTTGSLASTLGTHNPLRYRGYVYDTETGLYYLQSRYYNPTIGRFINADSYASTGQGVLGNNMFAYCRNNPVVRIDASGTDDVRVQGGHEEDDNPLNDFIGNGGGGAGGNLWDSVMRTIKDATAGLDMAMGNRDMTRSQNHHMFSDKSQKYTPQYKEIADRYDMSLNANENIVSLPGHSGRHTDVYHESMTKIIQGFDSLANGNRLMFVDAMGILGEYINAHPGFPYATKGG